MNDDFPVLFTVNWEGETLNLYQLLERLEGAQEVVKSLNAKNRLADVIIESLKATIVDRDETILGWQSFMLRISAKLARAGNYAHKEKNEVILAVIADLMSTGLLNMKRGDFFASQDMDDIPF